MEAKSEAHKIPKINISERNISERNKTNMPGLHNKTANIVFLLIALAFLVFELLNFSYTIGDENNYYYMAQITKEGNVPYKDFFFAHPPMQLLGLVIFSFFGIFAMKLTSVIYALAIGYVLFLILIEKGEKEAIIGTALFFTAHEILLHSLNPVGQDATALFLTLGLYFYLRKSNLFAGICFGLAALSGLYALVIVGVILMYDLIIKKDKRHFVESSKGFFISFGIGNLILILLLGRKYIEPVFLFQLIRPSGQANFAVLFEFLKFNLILLIGFILYFFYKEKKKLIITVVLVYIAYLAVSPSVFLHYYFIILPFMALAGAYSMSALMSRQKYLVYILVALISVAAIFSAVNVYSVANTTEFSSAEEIAAEIGQGKTLFGTDASLVALLSNGNIPLDYIDSNLQRFRSGLADVNEVIKVLNSSQNVYVITGDIQTESFRQKRGLLYYKEYEDFLNNDCEKLDRNFDNYHWVYKC